LGAVRVPQDHAGLVNRSAKFLQVAGRLRSGVSPEPARAELATIADRLEEAYPGENGNLTMRMASLIDETVGDVRTALVLLACAVGYYRLIEGAIGRR
jgi:putative ABC transport system permease protein